MISNILKNYILRLKVKKICLYFAQILIWIHCYDELYSMYKWNEFGVIQYEWLYNNIDKVLNYIRYYLCDYIAL